jgi:sugar/nucleoside kinase (ribokinase family)
VLDLGPSLAVVKKGEHGALVVSRDGIFVAPAYPVERVFDPTGAGDTFAGGFLGYLASIGKQDPSSIRRATVYGAVLASFTVEAFSLARLAEATREEIDCRVGAIREIAHF